MIIDYYINNLLNQVPGLSDADKQKLAPELTVRLFKKDTILLRQGDIIDKCYYVFEGCIRQYFIDEEGNEKTTNFIIEEETAAVLNPVEMQSPSKNFWQCSEDSILLEGDLNSESTIIDQYPALHLLIREMLEKSLGKIQVSFASFIASSPEERVRNLLNTRPELFNRVPQHQIASYLGMTAESLSRIKKRLS